jgi:hypothetical protein
MSLTTTGSTSILVPHSLNEAMALAQQMSSAKLVPQALQKSPGDCLLVIEQAMRWGMSPFAAAQEVSVIQGKLMYSGKIVAAAVQSAGILSGRLHYEYSGEGEERAVTVTGTLRGESEPRSINVAWKDAVTQNGIWKKQPDQQLAYHGARVWARRHVPEVMLGVYSPEEMDAFTGPTIDAKPELQPTPAPKAAEYLHDSIPHLDAASVNPLEVLRDRADRVVQALALQNSLERVEKAEKMARGLLADCDAVDGAGEIKAIILDAFIAARERVEPSDAAEPESLEMPA